MLKRLNDYSVPMNEVGMWAKVRIKWDGCDNEIDGIIGLCSASALCFANNSRTLDGSNEFRRHPEWDIVTRSYANGWLINVGDCGTCTIPEIMTQHAFGCCGNFTFIGIINEQGNCVTPNGSVIPLVDVQNEMSFIQEKYEINTIYSGIHSYHHHHGMIPNAPKTSKRSYKIGVELEVEFNRPSLREVWSNTAKSNWFYCERDGSLDDRTGVEIITIPMNPNDIKSRTTWEPLINFLSHKAKSWDSPRCGLHVHVGRGILGSTPEQQSETIGKLLYLYHHFVNNTRMNSRIFGREHSYNEKDGKTREGEAVATLGSGVLKLKEIKDTLKKGMIDKSSSDRYFDINLLNTHTIEFRKGRGSINASRIIMVIEYCEMLCKYAKQAKWDEISKDKFVEYVVENINKESPLYRFFEAGERCDCSF